MSDLIKLLPERVANQITAGKMVTNPAYIVKELMENSIDAGATKIQIVVKDGGKSFIQITDNGRGMSPTDARMAFERNATSKISSYEDLSRLQTMGFRGEALCDISSLSWVEMKTRPKGQDLGTKIVIEGGDLKEVESCVCPEGTTFIIRNIFFNDKTRLAELMSRKPNQEYNKVKKEFDRVALVNPQIAMSLYHDKTVYKDLPSTVLKKRILGFLSKNTQLLSISATYPEYKITGFVTHPNNVKKNALQYFFANNRYIEHKVFKDAVLEVFRPYITSDNPNQEPQFFIYFDVAPETIDVNVSPTKTEVLFLNEQEIETFLRSSIRSTLSANAAMPVIDFDNEQEVDIPSIALVNEEPEPSTEPQRKLKHHLFLRTGSPRTATPVSSERISNPIPTSSGSSATPIRKQVRFEPKANSSASIDWEAIKQKAQANQQADNQLFPTENSQPKAKEKALALPRLDKALIKSLDRYLAFGDKHLIANLGEQLICLDIQRAYERIYYDRCQREIELSSIETAYLLFPEQLPFDEEQQAQLKSLEALLNRFGFEFQGWQGEELQLIKAPTLLEGAYAETLSLVLEQSNELDEEKGSEILSKILTQKASEVNSLRYLSKLSQDDLKILLEELIESKYSSINPKGEAIYKLLSKEWVDRLMN